MMEAELFAEHSDYKPRVNGGLPLIFFRVNGGLSLIFLIFLQ